MEKITTMEAQVCSMSRGVRRVASSINDQSAVSLAIDLPNGSHDTHARPLLAQLKEYRAKVA
eukprot:CAMPEP_0205939258 /NCGR_PEP_ID=MMETSP1325-20131115/49164_1 /ASSEMBLY_ACC=CAM_ASM_000708 /TAXON_ID=236786 /ORGANISM="Florenciella sp., Strain RCC1007" /LENGTH=61 /DNA_ID=CAMNT_0053309705 /DNA_START=1 /DNA_END=183 /DNA_ORIENTATION=+